MHDPTQNIVYQCHQQHYITYEQDHNMRAGTRNTTGWYIRSGIIKHLSNTPTYMCSVSQTTCQHILLYSTNPQRLDTLPAHTITAQSNDQLCALYNTFSTFSNINNGRKLTRKLRTTSGRLVGDGSYDRTTDHGGAAFILKTRNRLSRITNAHILCQPINEPQQHIGTTPIVVNSS